MLKRLFDIVFSFWGVVFLTPLLVAVAILVLVSSKGGVFYKQVRVGKDGKDFNLLKFRSMRPGSDQKGLLTVGSRDHRVTAVGFFIRKFKIDELPQLFNVFLGDMSLVGPRPEVRKYVDMYHQEDLVVLSVKPGITDYASLEYFNENEVLAKAENPEKTYIEEVMPQKLKLNKKYVAEAGLFTDISIICRTIVKIFK